MKLVIAVKPLHALKQWSEVAKLAVNDRDKSEQRWIVSDERTLFMVER